MHHFTPFTSFFCSEVQNIDRSMANDASSNSNSSHRMDSEKQLESIEELVNRNSNREIVSKMADFLDFSECLCITYRIT